MPSGPRAGVKACGLGPGVEPHPLSAPNTGGRDAEVTSGCFLPLYVRGNLASKSVCERSCDVRVGVL